MNKKLKLALAGVVLGAAIAALAIYLHDTTLAVLSPKGPVAQKERDLIVTATLLMMIVVIPVFALTFGIAWRYRAGNAKAKYTPDWDHNRWAEATWWGIPLVLIFTLSVITWQSTHELDPSKPLASNVPTMTIQVVALDWKWLFIYPDQHIATVNYVQIPTGTPVNFEITADAPMNSFWIPQLGGQIYAMPGMTTHLNLMASQDGSYQGSTANISGVGYAGMKFTVKSTSQAEFDSWAAGVERGQTPLSQYEYAKLAAPSENNAASSYSTVDGTLYDTVVTKYMADDASSMEMN